MTLPAGLKFTLLSSPCSESLTKVMITSRAGCRWCQTIWGVSSPVSPAGSQHLLNVRSLSTTITRSQGESSLPARRHAPNTPSNRSSPSGTPRQQAKGSSDGQWPRKPRQSRGKIPGGLDFLNGSKPPAGRFREGLHPAKGSKDDAGLKKWSRGPRSDPDGAAPPSFGIRQPTGSATNRGGKRFPPANSLPAEPAEAMEEVVVDEEDVEDRRSRHSHRGQSRDPHGDSRSIRGRLGQSEEFALPSRPHRSSKGKGKDFERDKFDANRPTKPKKISDERSGQAIKKQEKEVYIPSTVTVGRLADIFGKKLFGLQRKMQQLGMSDDQIRPDYMMAAEDACNIALEYGYNPIVDDERSFDILPDPPAKVGDDMPLRPPVVTIMGHVDHGKTTLLDSLRHTAVAAGEAGGITQHIGAFSVPLASMSPSAKSDATITFLDTPGHAAFTAMRARGASVTDIVVLVVAADDGVMPQTKEVLDLVKSTGVGLVVAINKIDKPGVDLSKVKAALGAEGILLEEDGGDVQSVKVSGLAKIGLDDLVETISTLAELRDLRARTDGKAEGFVLESRVDKGRGNVATVLVSRGTLHNGASIVAGTTWCKVRQMQDSLGKPIKSAPPGTPVSITGWKELPAAGDQLLEAISGEEEAKKAIANRLREVERKKMMEDVEVINEKRREERLRAEAEKAELEEAVAAGRDVKSVVGRQHDIETGKKELRLLIKGDVSGTVEAVVGSLEGIGNKEAGVKIVHTGVGEVTESDVDYASASDATIIGFSVACPRSIQSRAAEASVPLQLESVIYRLIETVRSRVAALLPPIIEKRVTGEATVLQLFPIKLKKDIKMIAGCRVANGVISKHQKVRVLRGTERKEVFEGVIDTLKHVKKDVEEVRKGTECGIGLEGWNDVREGDEVVTFTTIEVPREL